MALRYSRPEAVKAMEGHLLCPAMRVKDPLCGLGHAGSHRVKEIEGDESSEQQPDNPFQQPPLRQERGQHRMAISAILDNQSKPNW